MPKLVRLYIKHAIIGYALSGVFVALLLVFNVGNLWQLISGSDVGFLAVFLLFAANGTVFSGVQFGFVVMQMTDNDKPSGGHRVRQRVEASVKVPVTVPVTSDRP